MDSKLMKGTFYLIGVILLISMCGCGEISDDAEYRLKEVIFTSKTIEGTPVHLMAKFGPSTKTEEIIIDNSFDELIGQYTLEELADNCERTAVNLKNYFRLTDLQIKLQSVYNKEKLWPNSPLCSIILTKPGV